MHRQPHFLQTLRALSISVISSGSLRLDLALGVGGIPHGRFIEICGPPACGKTTLCQHIIAEGQKLGGMCAFIDTDHALDAHYAQRCGIDPQRLYVADPDNAEQALQITQSLARSDSMAVIVLDSISALIPREELMHRMEPTEEGGSHRLLARTMRMLTPVIRRNKTIIILTNQARQRRGAIYHNLAANTARLALKLYTAIRLDLHPLCLIQEKGHTTGQRVRINIVKNNLAPCLHRPELDIMYNAGIRKSGEVLDIGIRLGLITRQGALYHYMDHRLGNGRKAAEQHLEQHPLLREQIEKDLRRKILPDRF